MLWHSLKYHFTSRYFHFGGRVPHRPVEDIAFAAARFFQRGGSFQNYYMVIMCSGTVTCSYNFHEASYLQLLLFFSSQYFGNMTNIFHLLLNQYHGGTNFGRSAGGPFITTSYDYDAPIDEYGKSDI